MTQIAAQPSRTLQHVFPLAATNASGETIPPHAIMRVVSAAPNPNSPGREAYIVAKPNGDNNAAYIINGFQQIGSGRTGAATDQDPFSVAVSGPVAAGQELGPVADSWALSASGSGFLALGSDTSGTAVFKRTRGGDSGPDHPVIKVRNTSAQERSRGEIVGLFSPQYTPADGEPFWSRTPEFRFELPQENGEFAVLLQDLAGVSGDLEPVGDAATVGVVPCQIDLLDESHLYAGPVDEVTAVLESMESGPAAIVWREKHDITGSATLGVQFALVRLNGTLPPGEAGPSAEMVFGIVGDGGIPGAQRWPFDEAPEELKTTPTAPDGVFIYRLSEGLVEISDNRIVDPTAQNGLSEPAYVMQNQPASTQSWLNPSRVGIDSGKLVGALPTKFGATSRMVIVWEDCG